MRNRKFLWAVTLLVVAGMVVYSLISRNNNQNSTIKLQNKLETENLTKTREVCMNRFSSELCKMFISEERAGLYDICAKAEIPKAEYDTTVYSENKIAVIRWWDDKLQQNITLYLPYEPDMNFAGCSESAKEILQDIQKNEIRY